MSTTQNFGLTKPEGLDAFNINTWNNNNDIIDGTLQTHKTEIGDLTGLPHANLADNVRDNISQLSEKVNLSNFNKLNHRLVKPEVISSLQLRLDSESRDKTETEIQELIDATYECGYDGVTLYTSLTPSGDTYVLSPSKETLVLASNYAISKGMKIKAIKIHNNSLRDNNATTDFTVWFPHYEELCRTLFDINAEYFTILNESYDIIKNSAYISTINTFLGELKTNGYKTGFSGVVYDMGLYTNIDAMCFHWYPSLSTKGIDTTYNDGIIGFFNSNIFNIYEKMKKAFPNKTFIVSESGCQRVWEALAKPEQYSWTNPTIDTTYGTPQAIFLNGLFNSIKDSDLDSVWTWYDDTGVFMPDSIKTIQKWTGGVNNA